MIGREERLLKINVGFMLKESAGYARDIDLETQQPLHLEDVTIDAVSGMVRLTRTAQGVLVSGTVEGSMTLACVRCLVETALPFEIGFSDLFVLPGHPLPSPDAYRIDDGDNIDLTPIFRAESILAIPMQVYCREDCQGLCPECGTNLNEEVCGCETDQIDPRLEKLRSLLEE